MTNSTKTLNLSNCCKLLAACLYEPDKALFMEESVPDNLQKLLSTLDPALAEQAATFRNEFENSPEEQLKVDYAALFVGPFELQAPPYGSVYMEKGGTVLGETTIAVHRYYEQYGLSLDIQEPADHIAIELEFMSLLAGRETEAILSGDEREAEKLLEAQVQFFDQFMVWIPEFCSRIEKCAHTAYYRSLGQCLASLHAYCGGLYLAQPAEI